MRRCGWRSALFLGVVIAACGGDPGDRRAPQKVEDAGADVEAGKEAGKPDAPGVETGTDAPAPDAADANDAADVVDAADADAAPVCTDDQDCNDSAFCNGAERCVAGNCIPGTPPATSDGVECTVDRCDEPSDRIVHAPNDNACDALDTGPSCSTAGANAGKLVRQAGVCNPLTGCEAVTLVVDDCLDDTLHPTTYSCAASGPARILRHDGACIAANAACGTVDSFQTDCATAIPSPHPYCSGTAAASNLTHHYAAQATCGGGANPACGFSESTSACGPGNPSCASGRVTTYTASCSASGGCGRNANTATSCPDAADTCTTGASGARIFTTYTPACASATACGPATPTATTCPVPAPMCTNGQLSTRTATCALPGGCGVSSSTSSCPDAADTCTTAAGAPVFTTYTPACASGTACGPAAPTATTCTAPGPTCSNATLTRRTATCALPNGCGVTSATTACTAGAPICVPNATVPTRRTFTAACTTAGTACQSPGTPTDSVCTTPANTCTAGVQTTHRPTCTGAGICGDAVTTTPCQDSPTTCTGVAGAPLVLTTFTPACNGNACGTPISTQTACTAPPSTCNAARVHSRFTATCDAVKEACGVSTTTRDCAAQDGTICNTSGRLPTLDTIRGTCDPAVGCGLITSSRLCNQTRCLDAFNLEEESGCAAGATACTVTVTRCTFGCSAQPPAQCIVG